MEAKIRWVSSLGLHACCEPSCRRADGLTDSLGQAGSREDWGGLVVPELALPPGGALRIS